MSLRCQSYRLMPRAAIERFQEWVYHTNHPIEALITENYFLNVRDRLLKGDVIEAYAVGAARAQHLRLLVSRSERAALAVAPFAASYEIDEFRIQEAELPIADSVPTGLQLRHMRHGSYRIENSDGTVVVGDIKGHEFGVDLFGRIGAGKITIEGARREVEKANLDAFGSAEHADARSL